MENTKYLIIGNGIAGLSAAKEIRKSDVEGTITMVSSEAYLTYYRLKLTELLHKDFKDEEILVNDENWYKENNIEVILNKIVEELDTKNNKIRLDDGVEIEYEKLLLATGSRPFVPPVAGKFKKGIFALRTLDDLKYVKNYFESREHIMIIGSGLLGLEAAWALKKSGKKVSVVGRSSYLLDKQLDEELSRKLEEKLLEEGFHIYLNADTEEILGDTVANGVKFTDGREIEIDALLFSVGVRPNLDLIRDTDINFDRGVIVNKNLKTNIDNVYAAGDVIEIDGKTMGLWTASNEQGKIVGRNILGEDLEYTEPKPYTSLQLGDIRVFSIGNIDEYDEVYEYIDGDIHHKLFVTDNKLTAGILFGDIKDMGKVKKGVENKINIDEYIEDKPHYKKVQ